MCTLDGNITFHDMCIITYITMGSDLSVCVLRLDKSLRRGNGITVQHASGDETRFVIGLVVFIYENDPTGMRNSGTVVSDILTSAIGMVTQS